MALNSIYIKWAWLICGFLPPSTRYEVYTCCAGDVCDCHYYWTCILPSLDLHWQYQLKLLLCHDISVFTIPGRSGCGRLVDVDTVWSGCGRLVDVDTVWSGCGRLVDVDTVWSGCGRQVDVDTVWSGCGRLVDVDTVWSGCGRLVDVDTVWSGCGRLVDVDIVWSGCGRLVDVCIKIQYGLCSCWKIILLCALSILKLLDLQIYLFTDISCQ